MPLQRTIGEKIGCTGVGLHSGEPVGLELSPAEPDSGLVFVRRDGERVVEIPARSCWVASTANATTLARDGLEISTVEHLLAAAFGLGIDNLRIEVTGAEVPVMDGSAASFVFLLESAGLREQAPPRRVAVIRKPVVITDGERRIRLSPARRGLSVHYVIDFEHPAIGRQELELPELGPSLFASELARARTFGFLAQVEALRSAGLARGASLENTVVLGEEDVENPTGLRWPDEFVRHKVLDLIGDLALLGHPLRGRVEVERGGHALHRAAVDALLADEGAWKLTDDPEPTPAPSGGPAEFQSPI